MGAAQGWRSTLFSVAGGIRFIATLSILAHAVETLVNRKPVQVTLFLFALLQLGEVSLRLPYMLTTGKAGWIQTVGFIGVFLLLCVLYVVAIALNGFA